MLILTKEKAPLQIIKTAAPFNAKTAWNKNAGDWHLLPSRPILLETASMQMNCSSRFGCDYGPKVNLLERKIQTWKSEVQSMRTPQNTLNYEFLLSHFWRLAEMNFILPVSNI